MQPQFANNPFWLPNVAHSEGSTHLQAKRSGREEAVLREHLCCLSQVYGVILAVKQVPLQLLQVVLVATTRNTENRPSGDRSPNTQCTSSRLRWFMPQEYILKQKRFKCPPSFRILSTTHNNCTTLSKQGICTKLCLRPLSPITLSSTRMKAL